MTERELFTEALLRTDPSERAAYLTQACGADAALRSRLDKLLALHESANALLDGRAGDLLDALGGPTPNGDTEPASPEIVAKQLAAFLAPSDRPEALGRLGHYDVLEVLGRGGFGIVVKAFDSTLHRVVAIKVLAPHVAATSPPRKRFLREARAAAQVRHENVVQIYQVVEEPLPHLVMEFVDGQTLQQKLDATGPLEAADVVRFGRQIALGLAAAHEKGLIHRDVKPANILIENGIDPRVKLSDFGLARAADEASMTQSGVVAGTPMFMAPEQAAGRPLDPRADLFSLGSVLYTMAAGRPPFRARTTLAVLKRVAEDRPRPLPEVNADVPPGLWAVIARLLEKKPEDRYPTARAAADALATCLTAPPPAPRSRRRQLVGAAAGVLLVAGGLLWIVSAAMRPNHTEAPPNAATAAPPANPPVVAPADPQPAAIVVTSPLDDGSRGTLRWAVGEANDHPGPDRITFDPAVFATPKTITLLHGPLTFLDAETTTITGPPAGVTVSGNNQSQVFVIGDDTNPASARLADLTVAQGLSAPHLATGGGVFCRTGSKLEIVGCTLRDNAAPQDGGGGLYNYNGTVTLVNCTLARNKGNEGGGIKNYGGGAVMTVTNCTFCENSATGTGGALLTHGGGRTEVFNCLFGNNRNGDIVTGIGSTDGDFNVTGDGSAPGPNSKSNLDPKIGKLGRHGGPTETARPESDSPARGAGSPDKVPAGVTADQRGRPRVVGGKVDAGAVQGD